MGSKNLCFRNKFLILVIFRKVVCGERLVCFVFVDVGESVDSNNIMKVVLYFGYFVYFYYIIIKILCRYIKYL